MSFPLCLAFDIDVKDALVLFNIKSRYAGGEEPRQRPIQFLN